MTYLNSGSPLLSKSRRRLFRARVLMQTWISAVTGSHRKFLAPGIESHGGVNFNIISRGRETFRANGRGNSREFFAAHTALTRLGGS